MKTLLSALSSAVLVTALSLPVQAGEHLDLNDENIKFGYSQGFLIGQRFKSQLLNDKIDLKAFAQGMSDALTAKPQMTTEQIDETMKKGPVHLRAAKAQKSKGRAEFLATNKAKDGVTTTASGLQYSILKSGPDGGKNPTGKDTVVVHYAGTLVDGTKFDSSYDRGTPATFGVGQVIPGWTEVLKLMKPGDKWSVVIPPELGYGARGAGAKIGPNEVLLFDVELISIK
ncbi:FKBP-type peptidyl-prolyl cis-trans isomerase FklB [hydrothermal vent metagenome]|uniref:peptidylprolyl isomerase n=1 Tax=hydrothermal vent metagenome TaxID=652676 RepID=A0A3B0RFI3_9ZZZZ